jgi:hypothetical protein
MGTLHISDTLILFLRPFSPTQAIFSGFAVLLAVGSQDVSASYDILVDLLESIEHFMHGITLISTPRSLPLQQWLRAS